MPGCLKSILRADLLVAIVVAFIVTYFASYLVKDLTSSAIQPIASTVATVSGILFGFVMASVTLLASAKENTLAQNTQKTQYLPKLVSRLHRLMAWLLAVCIIFLACLFIPDTALIPGDVFPSGHKYITVLVNAGVFVFSISVVKFVFVWKEFSSFASNM